MCRLREINFLLRVSLDSVEPGELMKRKWPVLAKRLRDKFAPV